MTATAVSADTHVVEQPDLPRRYAGAIGLGTLLQPLNSSMIAVALVQIGIDFHAGTETQWLVSGLYLATAIAAPTAGRLADLLGARRVFLSGLVLVALVSALAPFAPTLGWLIAARVLLGIGTGAQFPSGVAMIRGMADRRKASAVGALGLLSIFAQTSAALGPSIGGFLVGTFDWQAIFIFNLPVAAIAGICVLVLVPRDPPHQRDTSRSIWREIDLPGLVLFSAAMTAVMLILLSLADHPLWWLLAVAIPVGVIFVVWERRAASPFVDVRLLATSATLSMSYLRTMLTYVAFYAIFYGLPGWLEQSRKLDPSKVGLVVLPIAAIGALTVIGATRLARSRGPGPLLLIGSAGLLVGGSALTFGVHSGTPIVVLVLVSAVLGIPNGFNGLGNQLAVYSAAPAEETGAAAGLFRTSQYVGANLAAAAIALVYSGPATDAGLHRLGYLVVGIAALLLVDALRQSRSGPASVASR
ncbi:sugar phosphate permease [Kribbella orskensis]|uniref:Sugar phosphate permease n=1 Tax=Kribbella orskensis TaxID=2512216 RepID=A0ABY2BF00_9ACTN|nr:MULTISPECIES: MFS transporter [Kribbella]TCN36889.1 sugar phosphate permease [Kribbella sp. VKM Ac-2500]TCO18313.1 sugar phosphate permease [Kribbella orskensis]